MANLIFLRVSLTQSYQYLPSLDQSQTIIFVPSLSFGQILPLKLGIIKLAINKHLMLYNYNIFL